MKAAITIFFGTYMTLLAIINPLESLPVYLKLLEGKDDKTHRRVAVKSCMYAILLMFGFLIFGNLMLKLFQVPMCMVKIVGGIILIKVGFDLFLPSSSGLISSASGAKNNIAFVPLAIPLMFGPGAIATIMSMGSFASESPKKIGLFIGLTVAIIMTMVTTCLVLISARKILRRIGADGIDAATRIVGFFVAVIGMGLVFHGLISALQLYKIIPAG